MHFFSNLASGVTLTAGNGTDLLDFVGFFFVGTTLGVPRRRGKLSLLAVVMLLRFVPFFLVARTMVLRFFCLFVVDATLGVLRRRGMSSSLLVSFMLGFFLVDETLGVLCRRDMSS